MSQNAESGYNFIISDWHSVNRVKIKHKGANNLSVLLILEIDFQVIMIMSFMCNKLRTHKTKQVNWKIECNDLVMTMLEGLTLVTTMILVTEQL